MHCVMEFFFSYVVLYVFVQNVVMNVWKEDLEVEKMDVDFVYLFFCA
jgi:hypothetical protein